MTDWREWYAAYDDPMSSLSRRLQVVRRRISEVLAQPGETPLRVLSLCAGDGRDLLPVLGTASRPLDRVVLVEREPELASRAQRMAMELGLDSVTVITADAGEPDRFAGAHPVDLLLLCGIFGNVPVADVRTTIGATPALLRDGGSVIWTRGSREPDLRPAIRQWFHETGIAEVAFDSEPTGFGVGVGARSPSVTVTPLPSRLFTFTT